MPEWFLNLDGGILLWLQEAVRNDDGQRVSLADLRAELND